MAKIQYAAQPVFLTAEKLQEIRTELTQIDMLILPEIRKRMADAYEDGDMPENNPWLTANDDLNNAMRRKNELRELLARAKKFLPHREEAYIHLGSKIKIKINKGSIQSITLVASEEADPIQGKFSVDSPIGKALVGAYPGKTVHATTPTGTITLEILKE